MSGKDIMEALDGIDDRKLMAAMQVYEKKQRSRTILFRVAAMVATLAILLTAALWPRNTEDSGIISVPGVMKVYAYDSISGTNVENLHSYELNTVLAGHRYEWSPEQSNLYGLPLTLIAGNEYSTDTITLEVEVDHGIYYGNIYSEKYMVDGEENAASLEDAYLGSMFVIDNGEPIFWYPENMASEAANAGMSLDEYHSSFGNMIHTDITIKSGEHIVGYMVIRFTYNKGWYYAQTIKSIRFPMVGGEYQKISADYVRQEMDACRQIKIIDAGGVYHSGRGANESVYYLTLSSSCGIRYTCEVDEEAFPGKKITFDFDTNLGNFWSYELGNHGSTFTVDNDSIIFWQGFHDQNLQEVIAEDGGIFADVIIRADGQIIGYAVISIKQGAKERIYVANKCKTVFLEEPKSEEEVLEMIRELRAMLR